jgi:predicted metal-dependent hydrolase
MALQSGRDLIGRMLVVRLESDAQKLAGAFALRYRAIEPERPHVRRRLGVCYSDGTIRIRLFHARTGRPLKYSSLVDTLCHELAHLRHFNHGRRFHALYRRILEHARRVRIYCPGSDRNDTAPPALPDRVAGKPPPRGPTAAPVGPRVPEQLALF